MTEAGHVDDQHSLRYSRALPGLFTRAVGNTYHGRYIRWAHQQGLPPAVSRILGPRTASHMWVLAMFLEAGRGRYTVAVVGHEIASLALSPTTRHEPEANVPSPQGWRPPRAGTRQKAFVCGVCCPRFPTSPMPNWD